ncbi:IMPACT family protein [Chitinilyticum litopenaei]|uniref:IMPACT family protein n=1 Tax=Chitinilyticum litopenaei TaxID=1121276 RepID=UPI00041F2342|nr:YigZ family protein [Chitinilyticum litopenaei]
MPHTLTRAAFSTLDIKKSRFLGCVEPVSDRRAAQQRIAQLKAEHPEAAHVCWALLAGGQSAAVDDGEPSGTAGRPMLDVLRHQDLDGVLASVVRYYGGIRLGAGGLVRAYTDAVAQALLVAEKKPVQICCELCFRVPYAQEGLVRRLLSAQDVELLAVGHAELVQFAVRCIQTRAAALAAELNERCHGQLLWDTAPDEAAG